MPIVAWDDCLLTGLQPIDQHHRHLVDLLNKTYDAFVDRSPESDVGTVLEELIDYATYHFAQEERMMAETGYPERADHMKEHERFASRVGEIQRDFVKGSAPISLEVISFLKNWLINHISDTDSRFGKFATAKTSSGVSGVVLSLD